MCVLLCDTQGCQWEEKGTKEERMSNERTRQKKNEHRHSYVVRIFWGIFFKPCCCFPEAVYYQICEVCPLITDHLSLALCYILFSFHNKERCNTDLGSSSTFLKVVDVTRF